MAQKLAALDEPDAPPRMVRACSLDQPTRDLVKLIFDNDMFREAMKSMEIGRHCVYAATTFLVCALEEGREGGRGGGGGGGGGRERIDLFALPADRHEEDAPGQVEQAPDCQRV